MVQLQDGPQLMLRGKLPYWKRYRNKNRKALDRKYKQYRKANKCKIKTTWRKYYLTKYRRRVFRNLARVHNRVFVDKISAFDLWKIAKRQKCKCALTGVQLTGETVSPDHMIPKSKNGQNIPSNIRLVLRSVNIMRHNLDDTTFFNLCKAVVKYNL